MQSANKYLWVHSNDQMISWIVNVGDTPALRKSSSRALVSACPGGRSEALPLGCELRFQLRGRKRKVSFALGDTWQTPPSPSDEGCHHQGCQVNTVDTLRSWDEKGTSPLGWTLDTSRPGYMRPDAWPGFLRPKVTRKKKGVCNCYNQNETRNLTPWTGCWIRKRTVINKKKKLESSK